MTKLSLGLSGCRLELIDDRVLRKYSSSIEYNPRLFSQVDKQIAFSKNILRNIDTPKVYRINSQGLFYFDMEYVPGLSAFEFFSVASVNDVEFIVDTLFHYFDSLISKSRLMKFNTKILNKIDNLKSSYNYINLINDLRICVNRFVLNLPHTFCHGDLTFSNIIFHKNRLFFIDFLDCYVDTFLSDLVKLKQDLYYLWGLKIQNIDSVRHEQIYRYIWNRLESRYSIFMGEGFDILDVMNILRIEPYLTSDSQRVILDMMIKSTELYAFSNSSNGGTVE